MNIQSLQKFYCGFEITEATGNNAFSYSLRKNKSIWVPRLIEGTLADVESGEKIVFSEIEDGIEKNRHGLRKFVYFPFQGKDVFIFDNHNHAFFFWFAGYLQGKIKAGQLLIHIDQHSDMRAPAEEQPFVLAPKPDLKTVFNYTNYVLNVGNFIRPALNAGLFSAVRIVDSTARFEQPVPAHFVLDIDLDIFSKEMAYLADTMKINKIRRYIEQASFITIATSPFFIDQQTAFEKLRRLFN